MNKQTRFLTLLGLLLMGGAVNAHAQAGYVMHDGRMVRDVPSEGIFKAYGGFVMPLDKSVTSGGPIRQVKLTLKKNQLVLSMMIIDINFPPFDEDFHEKWSISFSGSAKDLIFQSDGNLVVRDANNKVLWALNVSVPRGRVLALDPVEGRMQIYDDQSQLVWEK